MWKAIWGYGVTACFGLFLAGLTVPSDETWKAPLLVLSGFGCVVCAIGWLRCHYRECKVAAARGDLLLTIRHFDYDESDGQFFATLEFYNDDSIPRKVLGVSFLYRPSADFQGYHRYDSGPSDTPWIGHFDELKLPPKKEETKHYKSVSPRRIPAKMIKKRGSQSFLYISFTNAKRETDHAAVMAMETPSASKGSLVSRTWPKIENLSLDSIRDSLQVEEAIRKRDTLQRQDHWYRRLLSRMTFRLL